MKKFKSISTIAIYALLIPAFLHAQTNDFGAIGSIGMSKKLSRRFVFKAEEEIRMKQNLSSFDRALTSGTLDYTLMRKILKLQLDYDFILQNKIEYTEVRHRVSLAFAGSKSFGNFDFDLRTRGQSAWRDETRKNYKINPKLIWRNKLDCEYRIFGSPLRPYASAEIFFPANDTRGFYMDAFRLVGGIKYRISMHTSMQAFLRYDEEVQQKKPQRIVYTGLGWTYKF